MNNKDARFLWRASHCKTKKHEPWMSFSNVRASLRAVFQVPAVWLPELQQLLSSCYSTFFSSSCVAMPLCFVSYILDTSSIFKKKNAELERSENSVMDRAMGYCLAKVKCTSSVNRSKVMHEFLFFGCLKWQENAVYTDACIWVEKKLSFLLCD